MVATSGYSDDEGAPYYLKQLGQIGDERSVLAAENIVSTTGMNLLGRGNAINSRILQRLLRHELKRPIDHSVTIARAVNAESLSELAGSALSRHALAQSLVRADEIQPLIERCFGGLALPGVLRCKLTVMEQSAPGLLEHSVLAATLGAQLCLLSDAPAHLLIPVVYAGLLQDVGRLYMDPRALAGALDDSPALRRRFREHPALSAATLGEVVELPPSALRAIREHHERCDGSGYPDGLRGEEISLAGRIISFIDFSLGAGGRWGLEHLGYITKTWIERFDRRLVSAFWERCDIPTDGRRYPFDTHASGQLSALLSERESRWVALNEANTGSAWDGIGEGFHSLHLALKRAGVEQLSNGELRAMIAEGQQETREVCSVLIEGMRHLNECCRQVEAQYGKNADNTPSAPQQQWLTETLRDTDQPPSAVFSPSAGGS